MTKEDIIKPENLVAKKPTLMNDNPMHYCPGCSHGVVHKLVAEVIEEMGLEDCVALFSWLNKIGKEPTSPEKIGLGMLVAALGFVWMAVGSMGLELPLVQGNAATEGPRVSANL